VSVDTARLFFVVPGSLPCDGVDHMAEYVGNHDAGDAQQQASKRGADSVSHLVLLFRHKLALCSASLHSSRRLGLCSSSRLFIRS